MAILGLNAKLYVSTSFAGSFTAIDTAKEVTLNLESAEADATTRGGGGWRETVASLKDATLEFEMVYDSADTEFGIIKTAFMNDPSDKLGFKVMDGEGTGSQGFHGEFYITGFSRNEPLEEVLTVSVSAKVASTENPPEWITAS